MDEQLLELARREPRYAYEAYEFVCEAVAYTQKKLGRISDPNAPSMAADRHVTGEELLRGACELALRDFGQMAAIVFRLWGIRTTDDFGEIVFRLIAANRLRKSDQDDIEDFHDVFDLEKALSEENQEFLKGVSRGQR